MQSSASFQERQPLGGSGKSPLGFSTVGLASKYAAAADDSNLAKSTQEAAALLAEAEAHLSKGEVAECLEKAQKAAQSFRALKDNVGAADALIVVIDAKQMQADSDCSKSSAALEKASMELRTFETEYDARGAACMQMKHAELSARMSKNSKQLEEAMSAAESAVLKFEELGDKKMEAAGHLVAMGIYFMKQRSEDTSYSANKALTLFKEEGDKVGEAKALHGIALSHLIPEDFENAIKYASKALAIYQKLGDSRSVAWESQVMAMWYMAQEKPQKALKLTKDALKILRGQKVDKRLEAIALLLYCEALVANQMAKKAIKEAKDGLDVFRQSGSKVGIASGLEVLLYTMLDVDTPGDATEAADEALEIARELDDRRLELNLLHAASVVRLKNGDYDMAVQAMSDAASIAEGLGDPGERADALRMKSIIFLNMPEIENDSASIGDAKSAAQEALTLFKEEGYTSGEASMTLILASLNSLGEDPDAVLQKAEEARELYKEAGNAMGESDALYMMVRLYRDFQELQTAYDTAQECVDLWSGLGKKKAQADALYTSASLLVEMQNTEEAESEIKTGLNLARKVGAKTLEASFQLLLAQVFVGEMSQENLPTRSDDPLPEGYIEARSKALDAVKGALVLGARSGDQGIRASALFWRSELLVWAFRGQEALASAQEAEEMFKKIADAKSAAHTQILLADLYNILGKKPEAREKANEAMEFGNASPEYADLVASAQAVLLRIDPPKQKKGKASKKSKKKSKKSGGKKTQMVKKLVKKGGGGGAPVLDIQTVNNKVINLVKQVITDDEGGDLDTPFMEAGIDSLGSVQLVTDIGKEFRMALAPSVVFDFPTVRQLAEHLQAEAGPGDGGGAEEMVEEWVEVEVDGDGDDDDDESESDDDDEDDAPRAVAVVADGGAPSAAIVEVKKVELDPMVARKKVLDLVTQVVTDEESADADTPFMEAGIDSLGSVQLVTDIGKEFRMALAPSVVFDFPTVRQLADHLAAEANA